jgi:small neutral amino acid transporter SnatA (MarC family)
MIVRELTDSIFNFQFSIFNYPVDFHSLIYAFIASFLALFPPVNPISDALIINKYITGLNEKERKSVVRQIMVNCIAIGIGTLILGHFILLIFGLAIPVIQLGGGIMICKTGLEGLWGGEETDTLMTANADMQSGDNHEKINSLQKLQSKIFYPLSFPICVGPGTISVIFTLMANASVQKKGMLVAAVNYGIIILAIFVLSVLIYIFSLQGQKLIQRMGTSGALVITKMVFFLTFCIGIQIIVTGISKIFHIAVL